MADIAPARTSFATRAAVGVALVLSALYVGLQIGVVRPSAFPAGAGVTLRGSPLAGALAEPTALRLAKPPAGASLAQPLEVAEVVPGSPAERAGLRSGDRVVAMRDAAGRVVVAGGGPAAPLAEWRNAWWLDVRRPFTLTVARDGRTFDTTIVPVWYPAATHAADAWLQRHLGAAVQMFVMLAAAVALVALQARGITAVLMTLTLLVNLSIGGALVGGEAWLPAQLRDPVTLFSWLITPLGFPIVALAVLHFPTPSSLLRDRPALPWALVGLVGPLVAANTAGAAYLMGIDGAEAPLAWFAARPWIWTGTFVVALLVNVAIVAEGVARYRNNPDANERRRIQVVVYTGVPAALGWALSEGLAVAASAITDRTTPPWGVTAFLHVCMLLPAFGLPYAVAVRQVFSPRSVLRLGLQYALARRTLTALAALPAVPLVLSLVSQRDMSLADIVTGRPLFYVVGIALLVLARRYRDDAARWLDRRFFRAEYDARQILVSLAGQMPFETEPATLVSLVIEHVRSALHPATAAVVADVETGAFRTLGASGAPPPPMPAGGGLQTLLRWSREPLEVFVDDERSSAARLPMADRVWLQAAGANLLVPILAGSATDPTLIGCLVLGPKQSEEPYTPEDRQLLSAIAAQMAVSLDLSRLRRAGTPAPGPAVTTAPAVAMLGCCRECRRCAPLAAGTCADHPGTPLTPVPSLPPVIDGKYRVDALLGQGGMGAVYRAHDTRLVRDVAVKVVRGELTGSADARARFQREALVVARLQHPAVVAVYDVGTLADGAAYLVMEYVRGEDLRQRLRRTGPLPTAEVVDVICGVAAGVQAAHDAGVLHRDLKPENVLMVDGRTPKVLDFGVAKLTGPDSLDGTSTSGGTVAGTPAYMAPEQLRGQATGATDVYSLGVMTFELLTGTLPFGVGSLADIVVAQAGGRLVGADLIPEPLRAVVLSALAYDAHARPASPAAYASALRTEAARADPPLGSVS